MWSVIDMDVVTAMLKHWQREPPVDVLVAAWVGFKAPVEGRSGSPKRLQLMAAAPEGSVAALRGRGKSGAMRSQ